MPKVSLCIPYHDTPQTAFYIARLMTSISQQTFTDYEIVLSKEGAFARNHNASIQKAKGEIVQMFGIDDYFASSTALENIVKGFEGGATWQITACKHDNGIEVGWEHQPYWTDDIYTGNNRLGGVSTLSFIREKGLMFEEPLSWLVDVDLYYRLYLKYGYPHLNTDIGIVINTAGDRVTNILSSIDKQNEIEYSRRKYK